MGAGLRNNQAMIRSLGTFGPLSFSWERIGIKNGGDD